MKKLILILIGVLIMTGCSKKHYEYVNLEHLDFLNEIKTINNKEMLITHIYASPLEGEYIWIDAAGEGISCIDDVARAVIVYLKDYSISKREKSLQYAKAGLEYVLYMCQEDGEFYNFIYKDYSINKEGVTSYKSLSWWAGRGLWALAYGYEAFIELDKDFAEALEDTILLINERVTTEMMKNYGDTISVQNKTLPGWMINNGTDVSGIFLDGLVKYYEVSRNEQVVKNIEYLVEGIIQSQQGDFEQFPYGMIPSYLLDGDMWNEWGAHQVHGLANAGRVLNNEEWIKAAKLTADSFLTHMLLTNRVYKLNPNPQPYEQIAYGTNMYVQSFISLYEATRDDSYLKLAGLSAAWFLGDNDANVPLYNVEKGYGYDGIDGLPVRINSNAGAESTIEALWAFLDIEQYPDAKKYVTYTKRENKNIMKYIEAEDYIHSQGDIKEVYGGNEYSNSKGAAIKPEGLIELKFETVEQDYILYLSAEKNKLPSQSTMVDIYLDDEFLCNVDLSGANESYVSIEELGKLELNQGLHAIKIKALGRNKESYSKIDAFYLYPIKASVEWNNGNGEQITVVRDIEQKKVFIIE